MGKYARRRARKESLRILRVMEWRDGGGCARRVFVSSGIINAYPCSLFGLKSVQMKGLIRMFA